MAGETMNHLSDGDSIEHQVDENIYGEMIEIHESFDEAGTSSSTHPAKKRKLSNGIRDAAKIIKLHAYKDCLGVFNSLVKNPKIALWYRESQMLLQKFEFESYDGGDNLLYAATNRYSIWEEERASEFLEINATILEKKREKWTVKLLDLQEIEDTCKAENFRLLGLQPYKNYEMYTLEERQMMATADQHATQTEANIASDLTGERSI